VEYGGGITAAAFRSSTSLREFILSSSLKDDSRRARSRDSGIEYVDGVEVMAWQSPAGLGVCKFGNLSVFGSSSWPILFSSCVMSERRSFERKDSLPNNIGQFNSTKKLC
jgi:hypothetical protein